MKIKVTKTAGWYREGDIYFVEDYNDYIFEVSMGEHKGKLIPKNHCFAIGQ